MNIKDYFNKEHKELSVLIGNAIMESEQEKFCAAIKEWHKIELERWIDGLLVEFEKLEEDVACTKNITDYQYGLIADGISGCKQIAKNYAAMLHFETHSYRLKMNINALRYDGSLKMAMAINKFCSRSWIEWDGDGNFCGLKAFTITGIENKLAEYVDEGDYLLRTDKGWYMLVDKESFEKEYEICG